MKCKLSEVIDLIGGGTPKTSQPEYWNGNIPWISVKDFNNDFRYIYKTEKSITQLGLQKSSTKLLQRGDVIISARGTVGEIATIPFAMAFNQSCYGLRAKKGIVTSDYLYYLIKHNILVLKKNTHGSVFDTITRSTFDNIEVEIPSIKIQQKISSILNDYDKKIELNNAINNNLERQAEALFHSLFVDNVNPIWKDGVLSDLGTVVAGGTPSKTKPEYYSKKGIAWITPKDLSLNKSKFISHGEIDISELGFSKSSAIKMPTGTVLFSSRAPIGYIAIAANEVTTNQGFKSVVPNENVGTVFMYYLLKFLLPTIEGMASGSTFNEISGAGMKSIPVVIPDNETIDKFNAFCTPIFQQQEVLEAENSRLVDIRDALLPKLMAGDLDVSSIEL